MGFFDFYKKKDNNSSSTNDAANENATPININNNELFESFKAYAEYVGVYAGIQHQGNTAPVGVYTKADGTIAGLMHVPSGDHFVLTIDKALEKIASDLNDKFDAKEITSYLVFYHCNGTEAMAKTNEEATHVAIAYRFDANTNGHMFMPYKFMKDHFEYQGFNIFNKEQNDFLFKATPKQDFNYFEDQFSVPSPIVENALGIKILKSNVADYNNAWGATIGFENLNGEKANVLLGGIASQIMQKPAIYKLDNGLEIFENKQNEGTTFYGIVNQGNLMGIYPQMQTANTLPFEVAAMHEWENTNNLFAIIHGGVKNTFGISAWVTDYGLNATKYQTIKNHSINLGALAMVVDKFVPNLEVEPPMGPDFTGYAPFADMPNLGAYHYVAKVLSIDPITYMESVEPVYAFMASVQLITPGENNEDLKVDLLMHPQNMRINNIEPGQTITGVLQFQCKIAE